MIDSAAAVHGCACTVDAGRRHQKGDSGRATGPFRAWRSVAAGRVQTGAGVVESVIYARTAGRADAFGFFGFHDRRADSHAPSLTSGGGGLAAIPSGCLIAVSVSSTPATTSWYLPMLNALS